MRHSFTTLGFAALVVCSACSQDDTTTNADQTAAGTAAPAAAGGGTAAAGTGVVASGTAGSSGGTAASGTGSAAAGSGAAGTAGSATAGTGARAAAGTGGAGSDAPSSGTGGSPGAGSGGSGGASAPAGGCTRELLKATVDTYYTALAAHDPAMLPRADNVKFTENGKVMQLGQEGLWKTAGMLKYKHTALDTETCSTVSESVVPDGSMDVPVGLRLKLQDQKITEIETIVVRPGDYKVFGSTFPSNTNAIAASKDRVKWEEVVPADKRNKREEIQGWLDKYFRLFPRYGCNLADNCQRLENGGGSFECSAALSCEMSAMPSGRGTLTPRIFVIDTETGIGVGFTLFMGNTDFHMIKMYGGEIHAVHAVLGAAMSSGWE